MREDWSCFPSTIRDLETSRLRFLELEKAFKRELQQKDGEALMANMAVVSARVERLRRIREKLLEQKLACSTKPSIVD